MSAAIGTGVRLGRPQPRRRRQDHQLEIRGRIDPVASIQTNGVILIVQGHAVEVGRSAMSATA